MEESSGPYTFTSFDNYAYWGEKLGRTDFKMGQFGENFTVESLPDEEVHVGDVFRIGTALFEVTQPRVPCYKLAMKMGVEGFYNQILESGRLGFYFKVLEEGEVGAGDVIEKTKSDPLGLTISQVNRLMYYDKDNLEETKRALGVEALSPGWKSTFEGRLAKAKISAGTQEQYRGYIVDRKIPESESITSFYLVPEDGKALAPFLPGQFLPLKTGYSWHIQTGAEDLFAVGQSQWRLLPSDHKKAPGTTGPTGNIPRSILQLLS